MNELRTINRERLETLAKAIDFFIDLDNQVKELEKKKNNIHFGIGEFSHESKKLTFYLHPEMILSVLEREANEVYHIVNRLYDVLPSHFLKIEERVTACTPDIPMSPSGEKFIV